MGDLLGSLALGDIGVTGLVVLFVLAILWGKLVPKSTLDNANANAAKWQEIAMSSQPILIEHTGILTELVAGQRASVHALQEIQAAGAYALAQRKSEDTP